MHKGNLTEHEHVHGHVLQILMGLVELPCAEFAEIDALGKHSHCSDTLYCSDTSSKFQFSDTPSVTVFNALTYTKYLLVTHSNFTGDHFLCIGVTLQLSDTPLNYLTQNLVLSGNEFLNVC